MSMLGAEPGPVEPGPADVEREATRVADRLRILAPRWAQRERSGRREPDKDRGAQVWADQDRTSQTMVRAALQQLAELAAEADGLARPAVPALELQALPDQVLVLARDAVGAGAGPAAYGILVRLRRML